MYVFSNQKEKQYFYDCIDKEAYIRHGGQLEGRPPGQIWDDLNIVKNNDGKDQQKGEKAPLYETVPQSKYRRNYIMRKINILQFLM